MRKLRLPLLALLVIAAAAAAILFLPLPTNLDRLAEAGEPYQAEIVRDAWGVPHIFGRTDADAAYGLAYAHAEDDFGAIQAALLAARGELAAALGREAEGNDYLVALLRIGEAVESGYPGLPAETRAVAEGYAAGLNVYAAQHPGEALSAGLFPVRGEDVVAVSVRQATLLKGVDAAVGRLVEEEDLTTKDTRSTKVHEGIYENVLCDPWCALLRNDFLPLGLDDFEAGWGSNTVGVGPVRTGDGSTLLAVNLHGPWEGAAAPYEAHVRSEEGWDMAGATLPGTPVILHGHNPNLGWALTANRPDLADVYELEIDPQDPYRYQYDGEWRELEVRQVRLRVKALGRLALPVQRETLWSVYGPTVRREDGTTFALRYAGMDRVDALDQLYRMNRAGNFEEWQAAVRLQALPGFSLGYADREGNLYSLYSASLPVRDEGYDWTGVLPGDTSATLWTEYAPFEALPQTLNPPSGFVQTGSGSPFETTLGEGSPDPADFPAAFGFETGLTNRGLRAMELLGTDEAVTLVELKALIFDRTYSTRSDLARFQHLLLRGRPQDEDPDLRAAREVLRGWDLTASADSPGMTLMALTLHFLEEGGQPVRAGALVGSEVEAGAVERAFGQAAARLREEFGRVEVPWSEANRLRRGTIDLGLGGGPDLLQGVYGRPGEDGRLAGAGGASYVMLVRWDAQGQVQAESIHAFGASGRPGSAHYADQAELFARGELKPAPFVEAEVREGAQRGYAAGEE